MAVHEVVTRPGDMHLNRALKLLVQSDGDVIVAIVENGIPIGDDDTGSEHDRSAQVEFCANGGRSLRTLEALRELVEAMKDDNRTRPIS